MKFLHISDLHIGKRINEFSMIEDQKYILHQILEIAERSDAESVLIAGDIYDKQAPSAEAVQVFDSFLTSLADQKKKIFVVSGNHDSAERLCFGAQLMRESQVYMSRAYDGNPLKIRLKDAHGELFVHLLPFIKPAMVRYALEKEADQRGGNGAGIRPETDAANTQSCETYQEAVRLAIEHMEIDESVRNILVAHQFVTGAGRCESEEVAVGGIDNVDAEVFDAFDYVALGHIHSPQWVGREGVRYCGTPLKYSFSESEQEKSVTIVELKEKGNLEITTIPLKPLHDMRKIRGTYMEVTKPSFAISDDRERKGQAAASDGGGRKPDREDYLQITLTDEEDIIDGFMKLRTFYPNLMRLSYDNSRTQQDRKVEAVQDMEQKSELALFEEFYELQNNQPMSAQQREFVKKLIESCLAGGVQ